MKPQDASMRDAALGRLYGDLRQQLAEGVQFLPDKPEETPDSTLRALWHAAAGLPCSAELALRDPLPPLDGAQIDDLRLLAGRRLEGTPLAHITRRQRFADLEMLAGPGALVPRKETELLARAAIDLARQLVMERGAITVLDACTGSGNVALAVAHHVPAAQVLAADLSAEAVEFARSNAAHLGLAGRVEFRTGDLLAPFDDGQFLGRVDLLTCNPPYISSAKVDALADEIAGHEPHLAFDGGPFGVAILMRLLQEAPRFLCAGGWLAFEVGLGQGPGLTKRLEKSGGYSEIHGLTDSDGAVRAITARC